MALANYEDLKTAVAEWLAKSNLSTRAADFIALAEADINRRVKIRQNMTTTQLTLSSGSASITLPTDFLEDIELNYNDAEYSLTRAVFDEIDRLNTSNSAAERPWLYAITSSSIIFNTEADQDYTMNLRYYNKWNIASDSTNWLLTNAPDVYLFGSLTEAADYQRDYQAYQKYIVRRDNAIFEVLKADARTKAAPLRVDKALQAIGRW